MTVGQTFASDMAGLYAVSNGLRVRDIHARSFDEQPSRIAASIPRGLSAAMPRHEASVWLEKDSIPRFILDFDGHILRANAKGRELIRTGVIGVGGMVLCTAHRDRSRLDAVLKRLGDRLDTEGRVLLRGQDDAWCMLEMSAPADLPGRVLAAMRRASELCPEKIEPLRAVFGLTAAETKVLTHLTIGDAPKDIGRKLSMSTHTVRAHLRAIFMKMGVKGINGTLRLTFQLAP